MTTAAPHRKALFLRRTGAASFAAMWVSVAGSTVWPRGEEAALKSLGGQALGRPPLGAEDAGAGPQRSHRVASCHPGEEPACREPGLEKR